jgi:hypothetical protein
MDMLELGLNTGPRVAEVQSAAGAAAAAKDPTVTAQADQSFRQKWQALLVVVATDPKADGRQTQIGDRQFIASPSDPDTGAHEQAAVPKVPLLHSTFPSKPAGSNRGPDAASGANSASASVSLKQPGHVATGQTRKCSQDQGSAKTKVQISPPTPDPIAQAATAVVFAVAAAQSFATSGDPSSRDLTRAMKSNDDTRVSSELTDRAPLVAGPLLRSRRNESRPVVPVPSSIPSSSNNPQSLSVGSTAVVAVSLPDLDPRCARHMTPLRADASVTKPVSVSPEDESRDQLQIKGSISSGAENNTPGFNYKEAAVANSRPAQIVQSETGGAEQPLYSVPRRESAAQPQIVESAQRPRANQSSANPASTLRRLVSTAEHDGSRMGQGLSSPVTMTEPTNSRELSAAQLSFSGVSDRPPETLPWRNHNSILNSTGEPFAVLDSGSAVPHLQWTHMNAHRAEAGFQDQSLGWVSVRAQADAQGGVHAEIVTGSASAAQALDAHLASLNEHVAALQTHLHPVTIAAPDTAWSGQGFDGNTPQGEGSGGQSGRDSQQLAHSDGGSRSSSAASPAEIPGPEIPPLLADARSAGVHVSLIA